MALLGVFATLAGWYVNSRTDLRYQFQHRNTIAELRELPLGLVRVRGVVTYVDKLNKKIWLQDESGAIAVSQDSRKADTRFGDLVSVEMRKTHSYDPATGLASLGLTDFKVSEIRRGATPPAPAKVAIPALSAEAMNGIRVTVEGVVHGSSSTGNGLAEVDLGDGNHEVHVRVPGDSGKFAKWLDSTARVTGVLEVLLDEEGSPTGELIWAQTPADLAKISDAPPVPAISTIRDLYAENNGLSVNLVRIRGKSLYQESPQSLLVEDGQSAIMCNLEQPGEFSPGALVEVQGFLKKDGLRIDLGHTVVTELPSPQATNLSPQIPVSTISKVRELKESVIRTAPPVKISGVVTYLDSRWQQFFIQDSTAGIFVKYAGTSASLSQGEKVTVIGLANGGDFAPVVVAPKLIPLGRAPLPRPVPMDLKAEFGGLDSMYGEVEGVVHPSREKQPSGRFRFYLYSALGPVHVDITQDDAKPDAMAELQDATVRVRGVVGEVFNSRKQLIGLQLSASNVNDLEVIEPGNSNPFLQPATPISNLLRFSPKARPDHRVVVSGTVTMIGDGFFYIQDQTGGVRIESDTYGIHLHDIVEAAGYATATGYSPVLTDAVVTARRGALPVTSQPVTAGMLSDGRFDSQLVSLDATLLSIESSAGSRTLSVTSGGHTFQAVLYMADTGQPFIAPREGSLLHLTGICSVDVGSGNTINLFKKQLVPFKLIVRSPSDIEVLKGGSWWTFGHSLTVMGILILAVLLSAGRIVVLLRRIESKNEELRKANEKESAVRQLIGAMREVRAKKQFTSCVKLPEADELALLGTEFNHMIEELRVRDIAMAEAEARLQQQALSDALTGLPNRRLLSDRLSQSVAAAKRDGSMVAVLYIDLDGFKLVNDSFGHSFGDMLLIRVTERIASRIRKSDTLARLGGDEFAVMMHGIKAIENAESLAGELLQIIGKPFEIEGQEITIGASIGICAFPTQASDPSELLQFADSAMYAAKRTGKNRAVLFTKDLGEFVRERLTIENQLRHALENGDITVHYQPEFEIGSGQLVRYEALARWTHETLGSISPVKFIPIAEESGLIIPLGSYIMERACAECVLWQTSSRAPIEVAVNVSIVQFSRDSFVEEVDAILKKTGLEPKLLQIELTESVMMNGLDKAVETIRGLQKLGVTVAIDDFGTGYSALSYIPKLPFNALKIDRTFMKEIMQRSETKTMVRSLVLLAHELGMRVIVEGIETESQLKAIEEIGANEVQGFLLGYPTPNPMAELENRSDASVARLMNDLELRQPERVEVM